MGPLNVRGHQVDCLAHIPEIRKAGSLGSARGDRSNPLPDDARGSVDDADRCVYFVSDARNHLSQRAEFLELHFRPDGALLELGAQQMFRRRANVVDKVVENGRQKTW